MQNIAVILDNPEQSDRIAPYLDAVAQPGLKIFFLIPSKARRAVWLLTRTIALSTNNSSTVAVFDHQHNLECDDERHGAERKLKPLRDYLTEKGTLSSIVLYNRSLKTILVELSEADADSLMVLRPEKDRIFGGFVESFLTNLGLRAQTEAATPSMGFRTRMSRL